MQIWNDQEEEYDLEDAQVELILIEPDEVGMTK